MQTIMNLILNFIDYRGSIVDGPGIRTVLFVQGCESRCEDCHNSNTWDINRGKSVPISDLVTEIRSQAFNKNLTISGGEPLLQIQAVLDLIRNLNDFSIALYTGFELEEVPKNLLDYLDYIKVGKYEKEKKCTAKEYVGSTNQQFINLREDNDAGS